MDERTALIALSRFEGLNNIAKKRAADTVENVASLFERNSSARSQLLRRKASSFSGWKQIDKDLEKLESVGGRVVTIRDKAYPPWLKEIPDAPLVLYIKGPFCAYTETFAIVGSRRATFESINLAQRIAETLSSIGITVVSGFARGIDSAAHRGALKEIGKTVAVLGCGIDICYPPENKKLFDMIGEECQLLTEYPPGERPLRFHFPERNRIIAGLSRGVLVIEASEKSGSLITARLALEYGREVMAVPGSVFRDEYKGANSLIKQGAKLVEDINDIISTCFPNHRLKADKQLHLSKEESDIFVQIGREKIHIDEIIQNTGMQTKDVIAILTQLEMKEAIREVPGGFYMRK